jgi:hypothetical protein
MRPFRFLAGAFAAALACPAAANACSLIPYFTVHPDNGVVLMVNARGDTAAAGPGSVRPSPYGGHIGPRRGGAVYGQVVRVERAGGPKGTAVPEGPAVLVPWDYDPGCQPTAWGRSARWLPEGRSQAVLARLRPREHWVDGVPTLDVFNTEILAPDPRMPAEEAELLFGFHAALPSRAQLERDPWGAVEPVRAWLAAHPQAAGHPQIRWSARGVHEAAATEAVRAAPSPVAGTWRLELSRTGGPTHVLYARTAPRPSYALPDPDTSALVPAPQPAGYSLLAFFNADSSRLPRRPEQARDFEGNGDIDVHLPGITAPDGSRRMPVWAEPVNFTGFFEDEDPELNAWADEQLQRFFKTETRSGMGEAVVWPDGRVTLTQVMEIGPGRVITLRGERISDADPGGADPR